jgi:hypothetical protein
VQDLFVLLRLYLASVRVTKRPARNFTKPSRAAVSKVYGHCSAVRLPTILVGARARDGGFPVRRFLQLAFGTRIEYVI